MDSKHTPGPWSVEASGLRGGGWYLMGTQANGLRVSVLMHADAGALKSIAATLNTNAALEAMVPGDPDSLPQYDGQGGPYVKIKLAAVVAARAALSAARGQDGGAA